MLLPPAKIFWDQEPEKFLDAQTAISNPAGARAAIIGVYGNLTAVDYYGLHYIVFTDGELITWRITVHFLRLPRKKQNILPDNVNTTNMWHTLYRGIDRANNVLDKVPLYRPRFTDKARINC